MKIIREFFVELRDIDGLKTNVAQISTIYYFTLLTLMTRSMVVEYLREEGEALTKIGREMVEVVWINEVAEQSKDK